MTMNHDLPPGDRGHADQTEPPRVDTEAPHPGLLDTEELTTAPQGGQLLPPGGQIGRFFILATLGVGGMGVVFSAYDPALERKVAIKLLRGDRLIGAATHGRAQLEAEAKAMARLSHPNVVTVHEIAFAEHAAFLVMDHITGTTLRGWLAEPRSWREVLAMFRGAGEGLAAAHRQAIVHRDFKPDNVLVDLDGRARVVDFGLAATVAQHTPGPAASPGTGDARAALAGTLAYMAPEQLRGEPCDARADQFAFCVALWEALHGERPFPGETAAERIAAIAAGQVRVPARSTPPWLRSALLRGLAHDPAARWPSLDALLGELARDPRVERRWLVGAAGVLAFAGALVAWPSSEPHDPCPRSDARFAGVWDVPRKASLGAAFAATALPYSADAWHQVSRRVDSYVGNWIDQAGETCRATRVEGRQSDTLLDLRMACLEQRRAVLDSLTGLWAHGMTAEMLEHAVDSVRQLSPLAECADGRALSERVPPPVDPIRAIQVSAARAKLDAVIALRLAHRWIEAKQAMPAARSAADATGWSTIRAEAAFVEGDVLIQTSDPSARAPLLAAMRLAGEARDDRLAARAAILLVQSAASAGQDMAQALLLAELAGGAVARAGNDDDLRGRLLEARADALLTGGKYDDARAMFLEARKHFITAFGEASIKVSINNTDLARIAEATGDYARAIALNREAIATTVAELGAEHPRVAGLLNNLAVASAAAGDRQAAAEHYRRALEIKRRAFGPGAISTATTMNNLGGVEAALGRLDVAADLLERALAIRERQLGPKHAHVATTLGNLGLVRRRQGRYADALALLERALAIKTVVYGPAHDSLAFQLDGLAELHRAQGKYGRALEVSRRALELRKTALGAEHPLTMMSTVNVAGMLGALERCARARRLLGSVVVALARDGDASTDLATALTITARCDLAAGIVARPLVNLERALAIHQRAGSEPTLRGSTRFALARTLWAAARPTDALAAARTAEHELADNADGAIEQRAVQAWLAARSRRQ